jgi:hypothetical protein
VADTSLTDPLGRTITLHNYTWYGHVLKRHPGMQRLRQSVEKAVRTPVAICFSTSSADCRVYFGTTPTTGIMVAVVADVVLGHVKTAYRVGGTKGTPEWLPPTP